MPKVPKIVEGAFSTIDSISNGPWCSFALIINFVPKILFVHISNNIVLSPVNGYRSGGILLK